MTPAETERPNRTRVIEEKEREVKEFHYKRAPGQMVVQGALTDFERSDNLDVTLITPEHRKSRKTSRLILCHKYSIGPRS